MNFILNLLKISNSKQVIEYSKFIYFYLIFLFIIYINFINYQKHKLDKILSNFDPKLTEWENMQNAGYDRVWDCGNYVFSWRM
jgi:hypothetical protein